MIITPGFAELLVDFDLAALEAETSLVFGLSADFEIAYVNPAWGRFAEANGGGGSLIGERILGQRVLDAISEPTKPFFREHYLFALREGRPWEHLFECSSADQNPHHPYPDTPSAMVSSSSGRRFVLGCADGVG